MNVRLRVLVLAAALLLASTAVARPPRDVVWSPKALDRPALDLAMNETGGRFVVLSAVGATPADRTFLGYTLASGEEWSDTTPLLTSFGSGRAALSGNGRLAVFALGTSGVPNVLAFLPDEAPLSPEWQRALEGSATDVAVSHDGNGVFVVGAATTGLGARAYHLDAQGRTVQNFQGAGRFNQVAVSFDGRWAVIGGAEPSGADTAGVVHVWSTTCCGAATKVTVPQSPSGEIFAITVDDRADIIAAGTQGGLVAVYRNRLDEPSADVVEIGKFSVPGGRVTALAVNSAGTLVAVGSASGTLTLFDRAGDGLVQRWNRTLNETVRRIQMDADGSLLLVTSDRVYAFHNSSSEPLWGLSAGGASAAISRRGDSVAIAAGTEVRAFRLDADPRIVVPGATPQGDGFRYTTDIVPGVANAVPVLLVNNGSAPDTLSLTVENASGFFPFPLVQDAFVLPGQNASAAVSLSPQTVPPGEYGLRLQVTSKLTGAVRNTTLTVRVGSSSGFVLQGPADTGNRTLLRGASDRVVLQIANTGNEPQRLSMLVQQAPDRGDPWNAAVTPPTVELAAGARTTVILDVSAPPEAEDGTANTLTVVASGRTASRNITLSYVLNPRYELSLEPDVTHKVVTPGNGSSFEITVRNTGSIPTTVQIAFEAKERGVSKGWGVLIDRTPFDLRPAQEKRLTLGVFSPRDAGDDDTLELIVNSTIPGHLEVWSNATVFATVRTAARPPVERAPFEVPDAGLALTILSLGLAGRGLQRRKPE